MNQPVPSSYLVLVVDDQKAIREAVRDILAFAGIDSIEATNGQEAVELFLAHRERIGAILLDIRMPVMNGLDAYHIIRQLDPDVRFILSTGYDDLLLPAAVASDNAVSFLRKPYAIDALLARVKSALAR